MQAVFIKRNSTAQSSSSNASTASIEQRRKWTARLPKRRRQLQQIPGAPDKAQAVLDRVSNRVVLLDELFGKVKPREAFWSGPLQFDSPTHPISGIFEPIFPILDSIWQIKLTGWCPHCQVHDNRIQAAMTTLC